MLPPRPCQFVGTSPSPHARTLQCLWLFSLLPLLPSVLVFLRCPHGPFKTCRIRSSLGWKRQRLPIPLKVKPSVPIVACWGLRDPAHATLHPVPIDWDLLHLLSKSLLFPSPGCSPPDVLMGHTLSRLEYLLREAFADHAKMAYASHPLLHGSASLLSACVFIHLFIYLSPPLDGRYHENGDLLGFVPRCNPTSWNGADREHRVNICWWTKWILYWLNGLWDIMMPLKRMRWTFIYWLRKISMT